MYVAKMFTIYFLLSDVINPRLHWTFDLIYLIFIVIYLLYCYY